MTNGTKARRAARRRMTAMAPLLVLAFVAASAVPAPAQDILSGQWREIGPFPIEAGRDGTYTQFATTTGRVTAVAVSPTNADHVFIGGALGGVWRSLDGGTNWKPILDDADTLAIDSLAIDSAGTLWVGTGSNDAAGVGLYRIPDAASGTPQEVGSRAQGPFEDRVAGTGTEDDTARSAFAGTVVKAIAIDPNDPDRMFVATAKAPVDVPYDDLAQPGLYYTENARSAAPGFSLVALADGLSEVDVTDVDFVPGSSDELLAAVVNPQEHWGIWRTTDATAASTSAPTFTRVEAISDAMVLDRYTVLAASGDVVYAATSENQGRLYKSTDRGKTFFRDGEQDADGATPFSTSPMPGAAGSGGAGRTYGWGFGSHHGTIAVDPGDPDNIYLGGEYSCALRTDGRCPSIPLRTVLHSSDGGAKFHMADGPYRALTTHKLPTPYVHPDVTEIVFAPSNPNVVYNGNDGGIYRADNGRLEEPADAPLATHVSGVRFVTRNTDGLGLTQFYNLAVHPLDRHYTLGGTQDSGGVAQIVDGGKWEYIGGGDIYNVAIDQTATSTETLPLYVGEGSCKRYDSTEDALNQRNGAALHWTCFGGFWAQGPGASLASPDALYWGIGHSWGEIWRTQEMGATVKKVYDPCWYGLACRLTTAVATSPTTPGRLILGHSDGRLRLGDSTGVRELPQPWAIDRMRPVSAIAFDPRSDQTAYVGLGGYRTESRIYKVENLLGDSPTFTALDVDPGGDPELPRVPITSLVIDPHAPAHVFAGTESGVFASLDSGETWHPLGKGLPRGCERKGEICGTRIKMRSMRSMAITRNILRIASYSRGMWEIRIAPDRTPPVIRLESRTPASAAGWNNGEVVLEWSCTDDESPVKAERVSVTLSEEGGDQTAQAVCEDKLGNVATQIVEGIHIDLTPPEIELIGRPDANAAGWYGQPVTLGWACQDALSGSPADQVVRTLDHEGADQTLSATCTDRAGNSATDTQTDLDIDLTPPDIELEDRPDPNAHGWYGEPVTIRWACGDRLSGPVSETVAVTLSAEGADQSATGVCTDLAGHRASDEQADLDIDLTPPVVTYSDHPGEVTVADVVSVTCTAEDALSGIASHTCQDLAGGGYEFPIGQTVLSAEAVDLAGHTASAMTSFIVTVDADSLCVLTRRWVKSTQVATSLCSKLQAAETARTVGNEPAADSQLLAYRQQLDGQVGRTITREQADILSRLSTYL